MATLTPSQLITTANTAIAARVKSRENGYVTLVDIDRPTDPKLDRRITQQDYESRIVQAAAIMFAESGGNTDARCYNYDKAGKPACSPTPLPAGTPGTQRGIDRGLWQFNSLAFPTVTDFLAADPAGSTDVAYRVSNAFTSWGPWRGSKGLDKTSTPYKTVQAAFDESLGVVVDDTPILSQIDPNANAIPDVIENAGDWLGPLVKLLKTLTTAAFWWRVGMGVAGVASLYAAVAVIGRQALAPTIKVQEKNP